MQSKMVKRNYLNLSLRSIFHVFVSDSLFYFAQYKFHVSLPVGLGGAFLTGAINEIFEDIRKVENSFHTTSVFKRDRWLAGLSVFLTTVIVVLHSLIATLIAPFSLLALTSYMDRKSNRTKRGARNLIKPFFDIFSLTLGPLVCVILVSFINR